MTDAIDKKLSCGVLIVDRSDQLLMLHVSTQTFWDLPKGGQHEGETTLDTAVRELEEETSLVVDPEKLVDMGLYQYNRYKDLYLYLWMVDDLNVSDLKAESTYLARDNVKIHEVDRFSMIPLETADKYMCGSLSRLFQYELLDHIKIMLDRYRK